MGMGQNGVPIKLKYDGPQSSCLQMTKMTKMTKISGFWALNLKQYRPRSQSPASHKKDLRALFSVAFRANRAGRKVRLFRPCQMCASHLVVNRCTISYVKMCQTIYIYLLSWLTCMTKYQKLWSALVSDEQMQSAVKCK